MKSILRNEATRHREPVRSRPRRRAAVIAQVAVSVSVLTGFAALTVDVGHMYNARAQLQRTADASALAAAAALADWSTGDPRQVSALTAQDFAMYNPVLGEGVTLESSQTESGQYLGDVIFGAATLTNGEWSIDWSETDPLKLNAVRVNVRRTEDSPSGAVPLYFASVFGVSETNIAAQATAVMTPRDIVFVLDLSASHNDDSSLRSFKNPDLDEIGNKEVYEYLYDAEKALQDRIDSFGFQSHVEVAYHGDGTATVSVDMTSDDVESTPSLSHVTFGLPSDANVINFTTAEGYSSGSLGVDPTTGLYGLKFEASGSGLGEDGVSETANFSFKVNQSDLAALTLNIGTKAGSTFDDSVEYNLSGKVTIGNLTEWGDEVTNYNWDFATDPGMVELEKNATWNLSADHLSETLIGQGYDGYTDAEAAVINAPQGTDGLETWDEYEARVKLALGINFWDDVDGDLEIDASEVGELTSYPSADFNIDTLSKKVGGNWDAYIQYVSGRYYTASMRYNVPSTGYYGDDNLRYNYGLKTWVDFLQEQVGTYKSEGMGGAPMQPMGAVTEASKELLNILDSVDSQDYVSLASYATTSYGPADKPDHMAWLTSDLASVTDKIDKLYPGIWTTSTNIAAGIEEGRQVLFQSSKARNNAAKVMILLTDGIANESRSGSALSPTADAFEAAAEAAENRDPELVRPVQIYTVSVGANADKDLMQQIAQIGNGTWYHAEGSIEEYKAALKAIFRELGTKRPVILIQ